MTKTILILSVEELCQSCGVNVESIVEIVEHGIVEPMAQVSHSPEQWEFESTVVSVAKSAVRMKQDLGVNWEGVALALDLLSQREKLYRENEMLKRRLNRFLIEG